MSLRKDSGLYRRGKTLLKAAYEYWQEHQRVCGSHAVVWLKDESGKLVVFTRGEFADLIMQNAIRENLMEEVMFEEEGNGD
jgi:hypothetical protein